MRQKALLIACFFLATGHPFATRATTWARRRAVLPLAANRKGQRYLWKLSLWWTVTKLRGSSTNRPNRNARKRWEHFRMHISEVSVNMLVFHVLPNISQNNRRGRHQCASKIWLPTFGSDLIGAHSESRRDSSGTDLGGQGKRCCEPTKLTANKTARTKHRVVSRHVWCDALSKSESMRQHQATFS